MIDHQTDEKNEGSISASAIYVGTHSMQKYITNSDVFLDALPVLFNISQK